MQFEVYTNIASMHTGWDLADKDKNCETIVKLKRWPGFLQFLSL